VGRSLGTDYKLMGLDTAFAFNQQPAVLFVQYRVPAGYERDTFLLLVRSALGPISWLSLPPSKTPTHLRQVRLQLNRAGVYGLFVYSKRTGGRIWASRRIYILLPPYQTLAKVKAYHNALLAQRAKSTSPPTADPTPITLPEPPDDPLEKHLPTPEPAPLTLSEENFQLPDIDLDPIEEPNMPITEEDDLLDEP
jgi:hypothetical protein